MPTFTGPSGPESLVGGAGEDTVLGYGGTDTLKRGRAATRDLN